ncbi:MAG: PQQ-binding-like beta-propeller repeat protein, partial [Kamptonema sp. SIO4C4]|nr:PQQ-binding-like beta-propeller repeat protein [Kamptonema sp. SIO4C4]
MEAEWAWREFVPGYGVSAGLGRILDRLVEPKPRQRYQSVTEVLGDLGGGVVSPPPTGTPPAATGVGSFAGLQQKLAATDIDTLLGELRGLQPKSPFLSRLQRTLDLSSHVLREDKSRLASQLWGRLVVPQTMQQSPEVEQFLQQVQEQQQGVWLRPIVPCFDTPDGGLIRTLVGHSSDVTAVAVTPEGLVISGSLDKTLKVWNIETGKELRTLIGHSSDVTAVAVTPEGQVISGSGDNTLKVWDMETGKELRTLTGHSSRVEAVAVTPEGLVISGSFDNTLKVWDMETGKELRTLTGHSDRVTAVAVTPEGLVISGSGDKTLKVWDMETGKKLHTLRGHSSSVNAVAVTPEGLVISGSFDNTLKVWDMETGKELRTLRGHRRSVEAVAVTPEGLVISGSGDKTLKV